jgi:hypothetical protein
MAVQPTRLDACAIASALTLCSVQFGGCAILAPRSAEPSDHQFVSAFTYQPINPLTVWIRSDNGLDGVSPLLYRDAFLSDFSNDATRVAMAKMNAKGTLSYGPVGVTVAGETYSMIIDYIKYMTVPAGVRVYEARTAGVPPRIKPGFSARVPANLQPKDYNRYLYAFESGTGIPDRVRYVAQDASALPPQPSEQNSREGADKTMKQSIARVERDESIREIFVGSMPLYVGVGIRVRADFKSVGADLKLSGLPGLSAEAANGRISGTLSVQTLGIGGEEITPLMQIPSDLSIASIQAAIQAAASIKVKIHDPKTIVQPMIVGFESPVTEGDVVAELTSFVYSREVEASLKVTPTKTVDGTKELLWIDWDGPKRDGSADPKTGTTPSPSTSGQPQVRERGAEPGQLPPLAPR